MDELDDPLHNRRFRIHIVSLADGSGASEFDDTWIVEYDPARPGISPTGKELLAHLVVTKDRRHAKLYSAREAIDAWSASRGLRKDGQASRPLQAFNVEIG